MDESAQPAKGYGPQWKNLWEKTGWWHSFELPDGKVLRGVNTLEILRTRLAQFPIAADLRGKRVLDIGCWDGWFSFELERRGAEVVALDCWDNPRFHEMHSIFNSRVEFRQMDVMDISPDTVGRFDIVLFLGVLYHLKHPLLALEKVCSVTKELAAVDSYVLRDNFDLGAQPVLEFYETDEFEGQTDNWVAPNLSCLVAMCRTAGFARAEFKKVLVYSASVACHRRWEPENPRGPQAGLVSAVHNTNAGINFDTRRDEYLTIGFKTNERNLTVADVQPSISGYGSRPIIVKNMGGDLWQANFKLPPGVESGWHEVSVAVRGGPAHTACRVAVDVPLPECAPRIEGVLDGTTWKPDLLDLQYGRGLAIWCSGLPENADRNNVHVFLNGWRCAVEFIAPPEQHRAGAEPARSPDGPFSAAPSSVVPPVSSEKRQINVRVPETVTAGPAEVRLQIGSGSAAPARIVVR